MLEINSQKFPLLMWFMFHRGYFINAGSQPTCRVMNLFCVWVTCSHSNLSAGPPQSVAELGIWFVNCAQCTFQWLGLQKQSSCLKFSAPFFALLDPVDLFPSECPDGRRIISFLQLFGSVEQTRLVFFCFRTVLSSKLL